MRTFRNLSYALVFLATICFFCLISFSQAHESMLVFTLLGVFVAMFAMSVIAFLASLLMYFNSKSNKYVEKMRVYFTGQNLLTLTKYSGQDPEVNTTSVWDAGIDYCDFYPTVANFLIGVNISLK